LWVVGHIVWKEFQGNEAIELDVFCLLDDAHSATTELFNDAVVRDGLPEK